MDNVKNRWLIAASAVGIHISIGSAYAWSVFTNPMVDTFGWDTTQISLAFSIAIFMLGMSAAFMGRFVEKHGPRKSGMLAAAFFGVGVAGSGLATAVESLYLLYLFYGIIGGIGLGIGYIAPVSTLVKWFPDRRGLATGLAIMGFGFAALLSGPAAASLIESVGISATFYILGVAYFVVMTLSSQYLSPPPEGWVPKGFDASAQSGNKKIKPDLAQLTANEAVKTRRFWMLWTMLFLNVTCGIAVISVASPMAQEIASMTPIAAATMVGLMGLFNGAGRIGWASFSDYIGRPNVYTTFFVIQIIAFFTLPIAVSAFLFQLLVFAILTCYGGGFASVPAYIGDIFGTKQLGAIHGYILTAWAAAGVVGPILLSLIYDSTNSYNMTMIIFGVLFIVAFIISLWIRADINKLRNEQGASNLSGVASELK
ncbi:OFA family MFS transporter [Aquibacillus sp. 3ASR75-11]|uniref:OFA family MFS transporter n=1 Tax=Terrihalobacillus insolitus TaxID=2950438 RepID=A0A9X3WNU7_9BACI|nr:OFA family MFS transporter [Terrihalobacillus insolitus]MDC3412110.1 OFA family MFS transporter [Terrihalobacillus insolitus]MDC3423197.1 OFA family MFS transporter [Terrihalobacillus insolitus]